MLIWRVQCETFADTHGKLSKLLKLKLNVALKSGAYRSTPYARHHILLPMQPQASRDYPMKRLTLLPW